MLSFEYLKQISNVMFSFAGLEHNFEKYTRGEVKTLECMKDFYDYDVSETLDNIRKKTFLHRLKHRTIVEEEPNPVFDIKNSFAQTSVQQTNIVPLREFPNPLPIPP